jgi:hypothetical protein
MKLFKENIDLLKQQNTDLQSKLMEQMNMRTKDGSNEV